MMNRSNNNLEQGGWASRKLVCLSGLPVDVIDMAGAMAKIRHAVQHRERLFLSTPNLNFLIAAQQDPAFRESVLRSDLSVADGMSLVLLGRIIGADLPERVTGSDLFEQLALAKDHPPIKVFFFGGPPGAGDKAAQRLNQNFTGVQCVGHHEAGYGDVASMSQASIIDMINASGADFVIVALGAKKGQAWILHNQHRLQAPVISHLGAVINFMAGTVKRSPRWLQRIGLEWVWRILQEPVLWKRYRDDGLAFLSLLIRNALPGALLERLAKRENTQPGHILNDTAGQNHRTLVLGGAWQEQTTELLRDVLKDLQATTLQFDLSAVTSLDTHALGTFAGLHGRLLSLGGQGVQLRHASKALQRQIKTSGAGYLLDEHPVDLVRMEA